jgi:hypothetical protein
MEKEDFYRTLKDFEENLTTCNIKWDRGNGTIERLVRFGGFDKQNIPVLYFDGGVRLDFDLIGGYSKIISIQDINQQF